MKKGFTKCIPAFALCFMLGAAAPALANDMDDQLEDRAEMALKPYNDVSVSVDEGVVTLSGKVNTQSQRDQAISTVRGLSGVKSVTDNIRVAGYDDSQTVGEYMDDAGVTAKVKAEFLTEKGLDSNDISVKTTDGVVMLTGSVAYPGQIDIARTAASRVDGVKRVDNRLVVKQ